jgi:DNA topoisomerase I
MRDAGLRSCDPSMPGMIRVRAGSGFRYFDEGGRVVTDEGTLARIDALVIPPAWTGVWICPLPDGHLQAVGIDAAGRKQYLYHSRWRESRDAEKFDRMVEFARALPRVREIAARDLVRKGMPRERVLAAAVRLLDRGFFRIGSEEYAEQNGTYGLATLRKEHVRLGADGELSFEYVAKAGKERVQAFVDPDVFAVVATLKRRRGGAEDLLAYRERGEWRDLRSEDINSYLKEVAGGEYSAKDFRTWHGTVLAAVALAVSTHAARSQTASKRAVTRAVKEVARYLGNTPAVCRRSYIDPRVLSAYLDGRTIAGPLEELVMAGDASNFALQEGIERSVLDLLVREGQDSQPVPGTATSPGAASVPPHADARPQDVSEEAGEAAA